MLLKERRAGARKTNVGGDADMTESSVLYPDKMQNQSEAAITALRAGNDAFITSKAACDAFINDNTNSSNRFNNMKRKMQDYNRVADAFIQANDADIADHNTLINSVGTEPLMGSIILSMIALYTERIATAENNINWYRNVRSEVNTWQKLNPFDWTYSKALSNQRTWERVRDNHVAVRRGYEQKVELYNSIEVSTRHLFISGSSLRATAKRGLIHIEDAASGLPHSYGSTALRAWRSELTVAKKRF